MTHDAHQKIIDLLSEIVSIDNFDRDIITKNFEPVVYSKRHLLCEEGSIMRYMYFINSGYLRTYSVTSEGLEVTNHINCPLGFITTFNSYISGQPSHEYLECITDSDLLRIKKEKLDALFQHSQKWAEAGRIINEQVVLFNERRSRDLVSKTAEERYLQLMAEHPDYIQYVPLQHIASFIGVKPESLSRIRRTIGHKAL